MFRRNSSVFARLASAFASLFPAAAAAGKTTSGMIDKLRQQLEAARTHPSRCARYRPRKARNGRGYGLRAPKAGKAAPFIRNYPGLRYEKGRYIDRGTGVVVTDIAAHQAARNERRASA